MWMGSVNAAPSARIYPHLNIRASRSLDRKRPISCCALSRSFAAYTSSIHPDETELRRIFLKMIPDCSLQRDLYRERLL